MDFVSIRKANAKGREKSPQSRSRAGEVDAKERKMLKNPVGPGNPARVVHPAWPKFIYRPGVDPWHTHTQQRTDFMANFSQQISLMRATICRIHGIHLAASC
jgi:hypothetical protein